jgi:hypothetical protein
MRDIDNFVAVISHLAYSLPIFFACLIGAIFIKTRPLPKNIKIMGITGLTILMVDSVLNFAYRLLMFTPELIDNSDISFSGSLGWIFDIYNAVSTGLYVLGVIFLIIAVCMKTKASAETSAPAKNPYSME